jgi:polar amino acid transport system substrate-binding protein
MASVRNAVLACVLALATTTGACRTISVCIPVNPFPPLTFPTHEGQGQWLVRKAVERQGDTVQFLSVPWLRCTEGAANGTYDAAMPPSAIFAGTLAFPQNEAGQIDPQQSVGEVALGVVRRIGTKADWNGKVFSDLSRPVMFNRGIASIKDKLAKLGTPGDESAHANESLMRKLLLGRGELLIMNTQAAQSEMAEEEYRGKLEILPAPFLSFTLYLAFNPRFQSGNAAFTKAVWAEIGRLRTTPEWSKIAARLAK